MHYAKHILRAVTLLILCLGASSQARAADKLVLSTGVLAPYTTPDRQGFLDQIIAATFSEAGVQAELQVYPAATERGMLNANEGIDDGLAMRVAGLEQQYPNLIRVPEPVIVNDFVAIATKHRFQTTDWDSLKPYVVSHIIGWKIFEQHVPKGKGLTLVRDADQLFNLLALDRADVVLYERWQGVARTRAMGLRVQIMEPPLAHTQMYIYLHKKHAALVPNVARALARLKANGRYQRIYDSTLNVMLK